MNFADIFSGDGFSVVSMTEAINVVPVLYGRVNELGVFTEDPVNTSTVILEFDNQLINLIPSTPQGSPAPKNKSGKGTMKSLIIPRIALDDVVLPADIAGVRQIGGLELMTVETATNKKLMAIKKKHDITNEYLKCGALGGSVTDAAGGVLLNLFTEFGVSEQSVAFDFRTAASLRASCRSVIGKTEDELSGDTMTHVHALCSPEFFDNLIKSPGVDTIYANYQNNMATVVGFAGPSANPMRDNLSRGFPLHGIFFEEYRGKASYINNSGVAATRNFVSSNTARFFPMGTNDTFKSWNGPCQDWLETVNTMGVPFYAKVVPAAANTHADILTQSNPLPICVRPRVLVKGTIGNAAPDPA